MKTRLNTILLIFSATLILSLVLFTELTPTANAVGTASQFTTDTEAGSLGTQERAPAAVNFDFTVIIDGGSGVNTVTKSPLPDYTVPQTVTLTAVPNVAWRFDHWDDNLADTASPKELYVSGGETITAHFVQRCFTLTRSHTGSGSDPAATPTKSAQCPTAGQYVAGEIINLSANPDPHWTTSGWGGTNNDASTLTPSQHACQPYLGYRKLHTHLLRIVHQRRAHSSRDHNSHSKPQLSCPGSSHQLS